MATQSFLKTVTIRNKKDGKQFVDALVRSEKLRESHDIVRQNDVLNARTVQRSEIKKYFGCSDEKSIR